MSKKQSDDIDLSELVKATTEAILESANVKLVESHLRCPHCAADEPSVWDDVLFHYAHPDTERPGKLKFCHEPWRSRAPAT